MSVGKRFYVPIALIAFLYCSSAYFGCSKEKYAEMKAIPSVDWVKNAVISEIDLRSIAEAQSFKALALLIPEIKKLGITVISLPPIHPIGELNRKGRLGSPYAVKDFYDVNPEYGGLEDFKSLVRTTHQHGLRIIIDLVANQAAWDSQLLMEHPDWFMHNNEGAIVSPTVEWSDVAQIDFRQHEPRKYMIAVMKFWSLKIGIDGFQCMNADLIPTDFWDAARNELEKMKPVLMISESMLPEHHMKAFDLTNSWDINCTCAKIIDGKMPASIINDSLNTEIIKFPKGSLHMRFTGEHEKDNEGTPAIEKSAPQSVKAIDILAFTLPGVPCICTNTLASYNKQLNVISKFYEDLIALRRNHPALRSGAYQYVQNSEGFHLFTFFRFSGDDSLLIVINFANEKKESDIQLPVGVSLVWKDQVSGVSMIVKNSRLSVAVSPLGFVMLAPSSEKERS
jgi:cyclomaltodextrinase